MAQHDYSLDNAAGLAFRNDVNNVLGAIISANSGDAEPTTTVAYMFWADSNVEILKQRNSMNSGWNNIYNMTTGQWLGDIAGNAATVTVADAAADTTTWPMLARSQTGDQAPATDAGLTYDASANLLGANISGNAATATNATNATNATGSAVVTGAITSSSPTAGVGYATGAGGTVTQNTSNTSAVTLNKVCGKITMFGPVTGGTSFLFTFNNTTIAANDVVLLMWENGTGTARINFYIQSRAVGTCEIVVHCTNSADTPIISFIVHKSVNT